MKISFYTLGCKVNRYETEAMKEQFSSHGFEVVGEEESADAYIINTCTVTNLADRKSRQFIRKMKKLSPDSVIAVTGCYSQVKPEELEAMPEVDIVTGNGEKSVLLELVEAALKNRASGSGKIVRVMPYDALTEYNDRGIIMSMDGRTRAYIKIEEGCDRFCSYCLIPFARGHIRSRNPLEIVEEAKDLIASGFRELVLTGINTALYGTEDGFREKFHEAFCGENAKLSGMERIIKSINELDGDFRIRLSSLEPTVVNSDYVKRLTKYERLCPHLHLSIQSGSDKVIDLMNRRYTREDYMDIVEVLRDCDSGYGITTDIIVGFPGEDERDFEASLDIVRKVRFAKVHVFKYSKREGTSAGNMKNQISGIDKNIRSVRLIAEAENSAKEFFAAETGRLRTVLFEEASPENAAGALNAGTSENVSDNVSGAYSENVISGYTENYIRVYAAVPDGRTRSEFINELVRVRLTGLAGDGMTAEIV